MAVHAAGETGPAPAGTIAVVLQVKDESELLALSSRLSGHNHILFHEPDPPYLGQAMSLGLLSTQGKVKALSHLRLWRMP